jgi:hypothetical protein
VFYRKFIRTVEACNQCKAHEGLAMDHNQLRRTISLARRLIGLLVLALFALLNPVTQSFTPNLIHVSAQSHVSIEKHFVVTGYCRVYAKYCLGKFMGSM